MCCTVHIMQTYRCTCVLCVNEGSVTTTLADQCETHFADQCETHFADQCETHFTDQCETHFATFLANAAE